MNYTELTANIQSYLQTTETAFVGNIDLFIKQAEERIFRSIYVDELRKTVSVALSPSDSTVAKPSDYLATSSLQWVESGVQVTLLPKDASFLFEAYPTISATGTPRYYSHPDTTNWQIAPAAQNAGTVSGVYYYMPNSIVDDAETWLGDNASSALLYGTLVEAYTYLKGEADLLQLYSERYNEAMAMLAELGITRQRRDNFRNGEIGGGR